MKSKYKKLELCWPGKDIEVKPEPRVLIEDPEKSYGETDTENMLIHADNLLALKALEQKFTEKIKCIYIDPPYNTGSRIDADGKEVSYEDGLEHTEWLNMMKPRLNILYNLLHKEGTLAVQIDDNEFARLYLLLAEIFLSESNLKVVCIKMSEATGVKMAHVINKGRIPKLKEYIIIARKSGIKNLFIEKIPKEKWDNEYKTYISNLTKEEINQLKDIRDNEERSANDIIKADGILSKIIIEPVSIVQKKLGIKDEKSKNDFNFENAWRIIRTVSVTGSAKSIADKKRNINKNLYFSIVTPKKKMYFITSNYDESMSDPRIKILFADDYLSVHPGDIWVDIKTTGLDNEGGVVFKKGKKPEALLKRIIDMTSKKNDWVLDSFAGSGTTGAVAHKMKRKWIMVELGNHCLSHTYPRLKKVVNNEDQQGITEITQWKGGGGFRFYNLAPSLLNKDKYNQWIINPNYNSQLLAAAMARHEGFTYCPSESVVWKQGYATENHFIFTTTNTITPDVLEQILSELKPDESLRICCTAFIEGCNDISPRIEIKKIPAVLLGKCEFGKEDYCTDNSIINMPADPDKPAFTPSYVKPEVKPSPAKISKSQPTQTNLLF